MKTTISYELDLPAPPAWMLREAMREQQLYEIELFERCMTIKEFRVLLLPILYNIQGVIDGHHAPLVKQKFYDYKKKQYDRELRLYQRFPSDYQERWVNEWKEYMERDGLPDLPLLASCLRTPGETRGWNEGRSKWSDNHMLREGYKILAYKNGRCPETRKQKAKDLVRMIKMAGPELFKPMWECFEILKKNIKVDLDDRQQWRVLFLRDPSNRNA